MNRRKCWEISKPETIISAHTWAGAYRLVWIEVFILNVLFYLLNFFPFETVSACGPFLYIKDKRLTTEWEPRMMLKTGNHVCLKIQIFCVFHPPSSPPFLPTDSLTAALQPGLHLFSTPLISRIETEPQAECCGPYRLSAEIATAGVKREGHERRSQKLVNPPSPIQLPMHIYSPNRPGIDRALERGRDVAC